MWARVFIFSCLLQAHASIVSLDLCADQWVLELVPRTDIFAVTYLAQDPDISFFASRTRGLKTHRAHAEELLDPAIKTAIAMDSLDPFIKNILTKRGVKIIVLKPPQTLQEVQEQRQFLIKELGLKDHHVKEIKGCCQGPTAVFYGAAGLSPGTQTLLDEALRKAGFKNGLQTFKGWKYIDWEKIVATNPSFLFLLEDCPQNRDHPFWKHFMRDKKMILLPKRLTLCACSSATNELIETMKKAHHA